MNKQDTEAILDELDSNGYRTNEEWKKKILQCRDKFSYVVKPRGMKCYEVISGHYQVPMPAFIDLKARNVNLPFMFAEAAWIISGSNRLGDLTPYMKVYKNFSDDGVFLRGAYGPKVVDQLPYVVDCLVKDNDSRQAVMTIWRERPGPSKDIPCTVSIQFFIREDVLHSVVTMRSNDIVLGFTYDVFTFSMIANAVRLLLKERGIDVVLGTLCVNPGSMHLYEQHVKSVQKWNEETERESLIPTLVLDVMMAETYHELIVALEQNARIIMNVRNSNGGKTVQ